MERKNAGGQQGSLDIRVVIVITIFLIIFALVLQLGTGEFFPAIREGLALMQLDS